MQNGNGDNKKEVTAQVVSGLAYVCLTVMGSISVGGLAFGSSLNSVTEIGLLSVAASATAGLIKIALREGAT